MFGCCLVIAILAASPRLIFAGLWLFTDYVQRAFHSGVFWPLLGLIFVPCTAIAYAIAENEMGGVHGWGVVVLAAGIVLDMAIYGSHRARSMRAQHWGPEHQHPRGSVGD